MPNEPSSEPPASAPQPETEPGAASGQASEPASATPSGSDLIEDRGPAFDPDASPPPPPAPEPEPRPALLEEVIAWESGTVASILEGQGELVHAWKGIAEADWIYTEKDLQQIVPPLVRLLNRYIPELAEYADPAVLGALFMKYATRSLRERKAVIEGHAPPKPGQPAPGPSPAPPRPAAQAPAQPPAASSPPPPAAPAPAPEGAPEGAEPSSRAIALQAELSEEELAELSWQVGE